MDEHDPLSELLIIDPHAEFPILAQREVDLLAEARKLFHDGYYSYCLLAVWNAAIHNLRLRVEAYGVDLFLSVVKDDPGRKSYRTHGETLAERWEGVDDLILINGATHLSLVNKKVGKSLEMINWMRNHASPAHDSDYRVERDDVMGLVLILQGLFRTPMPEPGHSVSGLFEPIKTTILDDEQLDLMRDQIRGLRPADVRVAFGFMLDLLCTGERIPTQNVKRLFPLVWERSSDDLKKTAGLKYHSLTVVPDSDESADNGAKARLLDFLTEVSGIRYIPDGARAVIYRRAAKLLADAKDSHYGWSEEDAAAQTLQQFGANVPSIAFEVVYQEILAVWCGNYWGRSSAHTYLREFIDSLNRDERRRLAQLFTSSERVRSELFQTRPKARALELLQEIMDSLTIQAHKTELRSIMENVRRL